MQDIIDWLNHPRPDYHAGVKLYQHYGRDLVLKKSFTDEKESPFKKQKLRASLQQLLSNRKVSGNAGSAALPDKVYAPESYKYWPPVPIADKVVAALYAKWKPVYVNMQNMQARIYDVAMAGKTDATKKLEACQLAHRILDLDEECEAIYTKRDYYYANGQLPFERPEKTNDLVGDPVRWATMMKNSERYVREFRAKLKREPGNEKTAAKLKEHEESVANYRKLLKLD